MLKERETYALAFEDGEGQLKGSTLSDLLPEELQLEWDTERRVVMLLNTREPHMLALQQFTKSEWLLLIHLIRFYPHYAPHELLLSQLTALSYEEWHEQLEEIRQSEPGGVVRELKPVYRALSNVRAKLKKLYPRLTISLVRNLGYVFTLAPELKR